MFKFEKLDVWQEAIEFSDAIYSATSSFPKSELYGLSQQMQRSGVSIAANIAEGSSRSSSTDFARFIEIAYGSLMETVSHLAIARKREYVTQDAYLGFYNRAEKLGRMLSGLRSTLRTQ